MKSLNHSGPKCFGTTARKCFVEQGDKSIPGPGTNSPFRLDKIANPEWGIGSAEGRDSFINQEKLKNPSPASYKVLDHVIHKNPVKHKFPKDEVSGKSIEVFHSLYNADMKATVNQDPSYSFSYRFDENPQNGKPGVGNYGLQTKASSFNKQNNFGSSQRMPNGKEGKYPGPGKYLTLDLERNTQVSFTKGPRNVSLNRDPEPQFYDVSPKQRAKKSPPAFDARTPHKQSNIFELNENPGPSHYNPYSVSHIPCGTFYSAKRETLQGSGCSSNPSPEKYTGEEILRRQKKGLSFGKTVRKLSQRDRLVPGPGTYEAMPTLSHRGGSIKKQMQDQLKEKTKDTGPSPAKYYPKLNLTKLKNQSTIVYRDDRVDFSKTTTKDLGPGVYKLENNSKKSELGIFGREKRTQLHSPTNNPGAGSYDIPNSFGHLPKYFTSPKKITQNGYSEIYLQQRFKAQQRNRLRELQQQKEQEKQLQQENNMRID